MYSISLTVHLTCSQTLCCTGPATHHGKFRIGEEIVKTIFLRAKMTFKCSLVPEFDVKAISTFRTPFMRSTLSQLNLDAEYVQEFRISTDEVEQANSSLLL